MYQIKIEKIRLKASIGCYQYEKHITQMLFLDVHLQINAQQIAKNDNLDETIDYAKLNNILIEVATAKHYDLVETLAATLKKTIDELYPNALTHLKLSKPNALENAQNVAVEYQRDISQNSTF